MQNRLEASQWDDVVRIFSAISNVPADKRQELLEQEDVTQATKMKVARMLKKFDQTVSSIDQPAFSRMMLEPIWDAENWIGKRVKEYTLTRLINQSLMSAVFEASQSSPIKRTVAIKLLRPDASDTIKKYFRFEQQALARLNHPQIGVMHNVEVGDAGEAFIIMEYIEGDDILTFIQTHKLGYDEKMHLFCRVCEAIAYSHSQGVLHRDIKPKNILVRTIQGMPVPVIIDFGISVDINNTADFVNQHSIGTLEFISPEQKKGVEAANVNSDIYSLGILLHCLLFGYGEQAGKGFNCEGNPADFIRRLRSTTPSILKKHVLAHITSSEGKKSRSRMKLGLHLLNRELDSIYAKATANSSEQRYQTVAELIDDVESLLSGKPVNSFSSSMMYRFKKLVRRNRVNTSMATLSLLAVLYFQSTLIQQNIIIQKQIIDITAQKKSAVERQLVAESVESLLVDLIESGKQYSSEGTNEDIPFEAVLESGANLLVRRNDLPANVKYRVLIVVTRIVLTNGDLARAETINNMILNRQDYIDAETDVFARLHAAWIASNQGDYKELQRLSLEAKRICDNNNLRGEALVRTLFNLGYYTFRVGDFNQTKKIFHDALDEYRAAGIDDKSLLARAYFNLGAIYSADENFIEADKYFTQRVRIHEILYADDNPMLSASRAELAIAWSRTGRVNEAIDVLEENYRIQKRHRTEDHTEMILHYGKLGSVYLRSGRLEKAKEVFDNLVPRVARIRGPQSIEYVVYNNMAAITALRRGDVGAAKKTLMAAQKNLDLQPEIAKSKWAAMVNVSTIEIALASENWGFARQLAESSLQSSLDISWSSQSLLGELNSFKCRAEIELGKFDDASKSAEVSIRKLADAAKPRLLLWSRACLNYSAFETTRDITAASKAHSNLTMLNSEVELYRQEEPLIARWLARVQ